MLPPISRSPTGADRRNCAPGRIAGDGIPLYVLVNPLSNALGRAAIDNTGLTGK
jgi:hypothetical protein